MSGYTPSGKQQIPADKTGVLVPHLMLLVCVFACSSAADAEMLTEQQAITRALMRPAVVDMERQHLLAAESAVREASLWPNPVVSMDRDQTRAATGKIGRAHVELQSRGLISYAVFCLKKKNIPQQK